MKCFVNCLVFVLFVVVVIFALEPFACPQSTKIGKIDTENLCEFPTMVHTSHDHFEFVYMYLGLISLWCRQIEMKKERNIEEDCEQLSTEPKMSLAVRFR